MDSFKKMGELLEKIKPSYDICSCQINFDGSFLPHNKDKIRFLKLYAMYEDIIYRFSRGEDDEFRDTIEIYDPQIILVLKGMSQFEDDFLLETFLNNKRYGISLKNQNKDLIKFKTLNMMSNQILWQNYITFFYYLLDFASK